MGGNGPAATEVNFLQLPMSPRRASVMLLLEALFLADAGTGAYVVTCNSLQTMKNKSEVELMLKVKNP